LALTAFAEVKERAAAPAVEGNEVCPQVDQIALFKIGQFTDNSWNALRCALKDKVNLEKRVYMEKRVASLQGELWPVSIEFVGMTVWQDFPRLQCELRHILAVDLDNLAVSNVKRA
jgi:hypothetical protein